MYARTVVKDGFVKIDVNGEILEPAAFMTYRPDARIFSDFRKAGIRFTSFGAYAPDHGINDFSGLFPMTKHFWIGEDRYDFSQIDHDLELVCPQGNEMYVFPRVFLDVPTWWEEKYPAERCMDDKGVLLRQSFASKKWREDAARALRALMDHIEASQWKECVVGYHIAAGGTEEWTPECYEGQIFRLDYSEVNRKGFCDWLREKYKTAEEMSLAWGRAIASFEDVRIPTVLERCYSLNGALRDVTREKNVIDFYAYTNDVFADSIIYLCRAVKEHSAHTRLAGAFYGYNIFLIHPDKGHFALSKVLSSPYVDFIAATGNHPEPGGAWSSNATLSSAAQHKKLFFCEGDIRTHLTRPLGEMLPHVVSKNNYYKTPVWRPLASKELTFSAVKKAIARVLTEGVGVWWFDMFGGTFDDPDIMELFSDFCLRMKERRALPLLHEIAFVVDETSVFYMNRNDPPAEYINKRQIDEISRMGAPVDMLEAKDLLCDSFDADKYRLIVLSGFLSPDAEVRRAIDEKLRKKGRTLLWCQFTRDELTGAQTSYDPYGEKRQGEFLGMRFPDTPVPCPGFCDGALDGAYPLAFFADDHTPALLAYERNGYREIVSALPALPAALMREVATLAGVHIYTRGDDVIYAGGNYVAIHARTAGEKRICLPRPVRALTDTETGAHPFLFNGVYTDVEMKEFETRIYKIEE